MQTDRPARGVLSTRSRILLARLSDCDCCPRDCHVDRIAGESGFCRTGRLARVSSAFPHFGEERVLVGQGGSGTIFLADCNLRCTFCQNREISHGGRGREVSDEELAGLMINLQTAGCRNVNLVSPSHVVPQLVAAVEIARDSGLVVPLVYNTSSYDSVRTLEQLEGFVDIYMPDFKFWSPTVSLSCLDARDYPDVARLAIEEMHRQVGDLELDDHGHAKRGLLVRHLVIPGLPADTEAIMGFLASLSRDTFVNVMSQYRPFGPLDRQPGIARRPSRLEMASAREAARAAGLHRFA